MQNGPQSGGRKEGTLYHLIPVPLLVANIDKGQTYYPETYFQDGFTHLTEDPNLLLSVANHFYKESKDDWNLIVLDSSKLKGEVKLEPAAAVGGTAAKSSDTQDNVLYPHLYAGINPEAVVERLDIERNEHGEFLNVKGLPTSNSQPLPIPGKSGEQ